MTAFDANANLQALQPVFSDSYERAVFRAAPRRFCIEFLPPTKQGGRWNHGMRISPFDGGDGSSIFSGTVTGSTATTEYDVWRTWEDCLWLQDTMEQEYKRAARERRIRLAQGKGVKTFNGFYKQDMASSWESLPPGPVPDSVALDVHAYLPHLTKKSSFFRPKPAVIERRQQEYQKFVEVLMGDDMPALIKEIRASRVITDFFGYWRRDSQIDEKNMKLRVGRRASISSSIFSSYFPSSSSLAGSSPTRQRKTSNQSISDDQTSYHYSQSGSSTRYSRSSNRSRSSIDSVETQRIPDVRRHSSSSESSTQSDELVSDSSYTANSSTPKIAEERPVKYDYNPQVGQQEAPQSPVLESLQESEEVKAKSSTGVGGDFLKKPIHLLGPRSSSPGDRRSHRSFQVYTSPIKGEFKKLSSPTASEFSIPEDAGEDVDERSTIRESWDSGISANTYLEGLNVEFPTDEDRLARLSISTFMTTDSAEGVIPPSTPTPALGYDGSAPRASVAVSLSDFEIMSGSERVSLLDAFPRPLSFVPEIDSVPEVDSRPETPVAQPDSVKPLSLRKAPRNLPDLKIFPTTEPTAAITPSPMSTSFDISFNDGEQANIPPSPTFSTYSRATISTVTSDFSYLSARSNVSSASTISPTSPNSKTGGSTITVKAVHTGSIILLKVGREITWSDLRQKLYNKFVGQEGVPLSRQFVVTYAPKGSNESRTVQEDADWREIVGAFEGSKLTLQVVNPS